MTLIAVGVKCAFRCNNAAASAPYPRWLSSNNIICSVLRLECKLVTISMGCPLCTNATFIYKLPISTPNIARPSTITNDLSLLFRFIPDIIVISAMMSFTDRNDIRVGLRRDVAVIVVVNRILPPNTNCVGGDGWTFGTIIIPILFGNSSNDRYSIQRR